MLHSNVTPQTCRLLVLRQRQPVTEEVRPVGAPHHSCYLFL